MSLRFWSDFSVRLSKIDLFTLACDSDAPMTASSAVPKALDAGLGANAAPIASRYVRSLLNRHDLPSSRHVTTVAQILGISYALAHRRMTGATAWEFEEVQKVAAHFGESLGQLFSDAAAEGSVDAVLNAGGVRVLCKLALGAPLRDPERNSLVAIRAGEQWMVVPAPDAGASPPFEVRRLLLTGSGTKRWRLAVLDDDAEEAAALKEHFSDRGCEVHAFTRVEDLVGHMKAQRFDGYIIDWVLGEGSAAELVGMIRADDRECPIAVLTGKMKEDLMLEPVVAEAVSTYKLQFFEKPTRFSIISAAMLPKLEGR